MSDPTYLIQCIMAVVSTVIVLGYRLAWKIAGDRRDIRMVEIESQREEVLSEIEAAENQLCGVWIEIAVAERQLEELQEKKRRQIESSVKLQRAAKVYGERCRYEEWYASHRNDWKYGSTAYIK